MSKRLRTSLASKRGRMLRPRSSSLPPPAVEEDESVVGEALASEPEELSPAPAEVIVVAPAAVEMPPPPPMPVVEAVAPTPAPVVVEAVAPTPPPVVVEPTPAPQEVESVPPPMAASSAVPGKKKKKRKHHDGRPAATPAAPNGAAVMVEVSAPVRAEAPIAFEAPKTHEAPKTNGISSSSHRYDKPALISASGKPEEEVDLSISHKFFVDGESMPPALVHEPEHELEKIPPPTKEALAHRARLKRIVGGVIAAASLFAVVGVGRAVLTSKSANAMPTNTASNVSAEARLPDTKKAEPTARPTAPAADVKPAEPKDSAAPAADSAAPATDSAAPPTDSAAPPADSADAKKADDAKTDEAKSPAEVKDLKMKAAITANGGDMNKAIDAAKAAISADPTDAMSYMYLYNDYSQIGKMKDAGEALNDCVRNATSADKWQCAQWGGHK